MKERTKLSKIKKRRIWIAVAILVIAISILGGFGEDSEENETSAVTEQAEAMKKEAENKESDKHSYSTIDRVTEKSSDGAVENNE